MIDLSTIKHLAPPPFCVEQCAHYTPVQSTTSSRRLGGCRSASYHEMKLPLEQADLNRLVAAVYRLRMVTPLSRCGVQTGGWNSPKILNNDTDSDLTAACQLACAALLSLVPLDHPGFQVHGWANIHQPLSYMDAHDHLPSALAMVMYLQVPGPTARLHFTDIDEWYTPQAGHAVLFPGALMHAVEPNLSSDDRVSLSFNANPKPFDQKALDERLNNPGKENRL